MIKSDTVSSMLLTESVRESSNSLVSNSISSGFQLGIRNFSKPHLGLRLGLLWAILDPLLRAAVFSFLMIVIRADTTPQSLVIGIFTITALNNPFSSSMNFNLKDEPFPLSHTPTLPIIVSKITQDALMAIFIGVTSGTILVIFASVPLEIVLSLPVGCAILSFIGSGLGIQNYTNIKIIRNQTKLPVIIDAGIGQASDATIAMELGCDGVLINTAIAKAKKPFEMAEAMKFAVIAGRKSFVSGRISKTLHGSPSTTNKGII